MPKTALTIGPLDHNRRMSLKDFDQAEAREGYIYELSRGVIIVSDVPKPRHLAQLEAMRRQIYGYTASHPERIHTVASSGECKVLVTGYESERHPDLAIYKTAPPAEDVWSTWVPEIVIEVVSPGSEERDYELKREEYLEFGVTEYWVLDADKEELLVLRRVRGRWVERFLHPPEVYRSRVLPGFAFDCARVFEAARAAAG